MLALRRVRLPSSSSRNLISATGVLRRTNATVTADSAITTSNSTQTPPLKAPAAKTREILLRPTVLKPKERRADTLPKPKTKSKVQKSEVKVEEKESTSTTKKQNTSTTNVAGRKRRRFVQRKRPQISLRNRRKWNRPLHEGVIPAYDEALKVIYRDSRTLKKEVKEFKAKVQRKEQELDAATEGTEQEVLDAELEKMREKLNILEVQSEINLPSVRWTVANAMADMRISSHRYLMEQRWRKDGGLDLLMERIHQMNVVPDVLPVVHPSIDLDVTVKPPLNRTFISSRRVFLVEPGRFLTPQQTIKPPTLFPHVYHPDTRLYTMLMVDPDVPDEDNQTFTTYLHWLKPNIPLSATRRGPIPDLNTHTTYMPPHPQRGTPYHRYTILLLPNPPKSSYSLNVQAKAQRGVPTSEYLDIPIVPNSGRLGFNVREFVKKWRLNGALGGGYHMFRQVWDPTVTGIYAAVLGQSEPHYGVPQKDNPYAAFKTFKKYV